MDKINRALLATEDNSELLRRLNKKVKTAEADTQANRTDIAVNKTNIDALGTAVNKLKAGARKFVGDTRGNATLLGNARSNGGTVAIVTFTGNTVSLLFCGTALVTGASPLIAVLPAGNGAVTLNGARASSVAIFLFEE